MQHVRSMLAGLFELEPPPASPQDALHAYDKLRKRYEQVIDVLQAALEHTDLLQREISELKDSLERIRAGREDVVAETVREVPAGYHHDYRVERMEAQITSFKLQLQKANAEVAESKAAAERHKNEYRITLRNLEAQTKLVSELQQSLTQSKVEYEVLLNANTELQAQLEASAAAHTQKIQTMENESRWQMAALTGRCASHTDYITQLESRVLSVSSQAASLKEQLESDSRFKEFMHLRSENTSLKSEISRLKRVHLDSGSSASSVVSGHSSPTGEHRLGGSLRHQRVINDAHGRSIDFTARQFTDHTVDAVITVKPKSVTPQPSVTATGSRRLNATGLQRSASTESLPRLPSLISPTHDPPPKLITEPVALRK